MFLKFFIFSMVIAGAICKPQLLTFNDGKVGVNFGGYHAEAGLGGILTGNNAHGGLSASAGTPHGQRAAAGIGGSVGGNFNNRQLRRQQRRNLNGRTLGGAYAGATAGEGIGASAGLGGSVGEGGSLGSNSYAGGKSRTYIKRIEYDNQAPVQRAGETGGNVEVQKNVVQKIKPPKKYSDNSENHIQSSKIDTRSDVVESKPSAVNNQLGNVASGGQEPQVFVFRKRLRPLRRRLHHLRKHIQPVYYQPIQEIGAEPLAPVNVVKTKQVFVNNPVPTATRFSGSAEGSIGGGSNFFDSIFNIPISTLRAVNGFLNQGFGGGVAVKKTVDVHNY